MVFNMAEVRIKKAVIREDLLSITNDYRKAIILNQFIYWSERVSDADKFIQKENEIAKSNGEEERELFYGWIYKTAEELADEVMLGLSASQIRRYISDLVNMGYISKRNNPKYKWDRTLQYRVNLVNIAKDLKKNGYPLSDYKIEIPENEKTIVHECVINNEPMENQTQASDEAIPEITTENINRDYTTENKYALSESKDSSRGDIYAFSAEKGGSKSDVIKNLAVEFADCEPSDWRIEELKHIINYFLEQYNETLNMSHIRITEQALTKIVINYFEPVGNYMSDNSAYGFDDYYKELIDYYLQTKYKINGKEVTKSLQHFMSGMIRENLAQKYLK